MATLTFTCSNSAIVTGSRTYNVSDADLQTLINAVIARDSVHISTPSQALLSLIQKWVNDAQALALDYQKGSVVSAVTPIAIS